MRAVTIRHCLTFIVTISACLLTAASNSQLPAQELLGYWELEETDDDQDAVDSSGNGLTGEYEGDVDPNVEGAPGFGSGAYFDGFTAAVLIGPGDENGFGDLTSDFTVMAWINPEQFDRKNRVFGGFPVGGGWGWGTAGDSLQITTYGVRDFTQSVPLELDEWTHAAVVLDADNVASFYANGEFVGSQSHGSEGNTTFNDFYIGFSCCDTPNEHFEGRLDEIGVFSGSLTDEQIMNAMMFGVSNFNGGGGLAGDYNDNGSLDAGDLDLHASEGIANQDLTYDANGDGVVDVADRVVWTNDLKNTWMGDSDLNGVFDSSDFVLVFGEGKYETGGAATWGQGDWNGDLLFDSGDFVAAFGNGGYEMGERPGGPNPVAMSVPEPSSMLLIALASLALLAVRRST